jgi:peptidoglycan/xylan/chitin deacetylase (PgdA/CDA1 family)
MGKKFLFSIILAIFIVQSYQNVSAEPITYDSSVVEVKEQISTIRSGASEKYKKKNIVEKGKKMVVTSSFINSLNEQWLQVRIDGSSGWIKEKDVMPLELKNSFMTSSSNFVHIRRGAHATYKQVGVLTKGQVVQVHDQFTNSLGERWVRIDEGWAPLSEIEPFDGSKNYLNKVIEVSKDTPARRSASYKAKTMYPLKKGKSLTIYSSFRTNNEEWYRFKDGQKSGWVLASDVVKKTNPTHVNYVKDSKASVRRGASTNYKVVAHLSYGQKVSVTSQFINSNHEVWYKVSTGTESLGWILASSLSNEKIKVAYLTIDDGPTVFTTKLLNILDQYDAKATFFMMDGRMSDHPTDVKRMVKDGHAVGSHSVTHNKDIFYKSPASALAEMMTTRGTLKKITGVHSNLMRVPYGSIPFMKQSYRDEMIKEHFIMWDWNVDSLDWKFNSTKYVNHTLHQVEQQEKNGSTPYILIHDRKSTVDHLPLLLAGLEKRGYTLVPLNEKIPPYQFQLKK